MRFLFLMVVVAYKIIETPKLSWYHCKTGNSDTVNYRGQWEKYRAMGVSGIYSDAL